MAEIIFLSSILLLIVSGYGLVYCLIQSDMRTWKRTLGEFLFICGLAVAFSLLAVVVFTCRNCGHVPFENIISGSDFCPICGSRVSYRN